MKLTVAKAIVRFLEQAGVEIAAGYNGHGNWAMLDAVEHESKIQGIKTNAEDAAVHLADCYWRVRRRPPLSHGRTRPWRRWCGLTKRRFPADAGYRNELLPIPIRWDQPPVMNPDEWVKGILPD